MRMLKLGVVMGVLAALMSPAAAKVVEKSGRFGGLELVYKVVLPPGYDAAKGYPLVLVFTGGSQIARIADGTIANDWREEAEKRGYVVAVPIAPNGQLFFEGGDKVFPEFLDYLKKEYRPPGGKMHVAGHSNGGLSAFHVAALYPAYFRTLTGYPGLLNDEDMIRATALKPLCIHMHVGDQDDGWLSAMEDQAERMSQKGYDISLSVEKNQIHRLKAQEIDLSRRLFDQIENCK